VTSHDTSPASRDGNAVPRRASRTDS
jgi:hypothetical protein